MKPFSARLSIIMAEPVKLRYRVIHCTSEDPDYPSSQLNIVAPSTKGWQSVRNCLYPQEIGFELLNAEAKISKIQVLSHQSKIAKKIDIFIGVGSDYETANYRRLGYLSLDSNDRSSFQARELKTVFVEHVAHFVKFVIQEFHKNKINVHNQVGIIAVSFLGEEFAESGNSGRNAPNGSKQPQRIPPFRNPYNDLTVDLTLDPQTAGKLRQLADAKRKAIESEDYVTAKQIKSVELELKTLGSRLAQLDMAKGEAVAAEDYDLAKEIKDESDSLRVEIEQKIREIRIPGIKAVSAAAPPLIAAPPRFAPAKDDYSPNPEAELVVQQKSGPIDIDSIPVGRTAQPARPPPEQFLEDDGGDLMERPIRTKNMVDYSTADDGTMNGGGESDPLASTGMPMERFAPGQHPLEGVPNCYDLQTPEALTLKAREFCDQSGINKIFGEYLARCLYSRVWQLREAAVTKAQLMLKNELSGDIAGCLSAICGILRLGAEDKIQQVLFNSLTLMEQLLVILKRERLPKTVTGPVFDPIIAQFIEKLADGNARLREGARKGLDMLASSPAVGAAAVANFAVRALPPKLKTAWRPLASRTSLLADLVKEFGLGSSGLTMDPLVNFAKINGAFAHSNVEVRDAAKDLIVAIQKHVGTAPLEVSVLSTLRKKQRDDYEAAFNGGDSKPVAAAIAPSAAASKGGGGSRAEAGNKGSPTKRTDMSHQHATHNPGGKVPTSSARTSDRGQGYDTSPGKGDGDGDKAGGDFTSCMFCGVQNRSWTENELDLHYWKDCPLLISCPSCAQIVEIAGLPEHLLDECEAKNSYVPCEITGLAIRKNEYESWKNSSRCVPAPENFMYCPLCLDAVDDSDQAWKHHLTADCKKNNRVKGASSS